MYKFDQNTSWDSLDLSFPAINEGIPKDFHLSNKIDLSFPRVDDFIELKWRVGIVIYIKEM